MIKQKKLNKCWHKKQRQGFLPAAVYRLGVNKISVHDLGGSVADVVHSTNPRHLIIRFELFGHTLTLCHLFHQPRKHFFRLSVNISKVTV